MFATLKRLFTTESNERPFFYGDGGSTFVTPANDNGPTFNLERGMDGDWLITTTQNSYTTVVAAYSRKRDAIRGAGRRGILLANV